MFPPSFGTLAPWKWGRKGRERKVGPSLAPVGDEADQLWAGSSGVVVADEQAGGSGDTLGDPGVLAMDPSLGCVMVEAVPPGVVTVPESPCDQFISPDPVGLTQLEDAGGLSPPCLPRSPPMSPSPLQQGPA